MSRPESASTHTSCSLTEAAIKDMVAKATAKGPISIEPTRIVLERLLDTFEEGAAR